MTYHLDHNDHARHAIRKHLTPHMDAATLLLLEELIMSTITPIIDQLTAKVTALKTSNDALTASVTEKDILLATAQQQAQAAQAQLATAQANAFDPADVQKLQDLLSSLV